MIKRTLLIALAVLGTVALGSAAQALTPTYSVTALPPLPDGDVFLGLNDRGIALVLDPSTWCLYAHGQYTFPVTPTGDNFEDALAINNSGAVTGRLSEAGGNEVGYIYANGKTVTFAPPGAASVTPMDINDLGQIVGGVSLNGSAYTFLRQPDGTIVNLVNFDGWSYINNQGTIVISDSTAVYIRQPGSTKLQQVPPLSTGDSMGVNAINNFGVVIGDDYISGVTVGHGFAYANGKTTDLGTLPPAGVDAFSFADGINTWGQIVGESAGSGGPQHGYIYYDGVMHDLNSMLAASATGWVIISAQYINDFGLIAGSASYQGGRAELVILTPNGMLPAM